MGEEIITKEKQNEIYIWLLNNVLYYKDSKYTQKHYTLRKDGKINVYCSVSISNNTTEFKYPFGYVKGGFNCFNCCKLTSLIGLPEKIVGDFDCENCKKITSLIGFPKIITGDIYIDNDNFSNFDKEDGSYNFYVDMWFELLESVSEDEKWEYINNYKNKVDFRFAYPIIPKEVMNKYKIDFLLKELNYGR